MSWFESDLASMIKKSVAGLIRAKTRLRSILGAFFLPAAGGNQIESILCSYHLNEA